MPQSPGEVTSTLIHTSESSMVDRFILNLQSFITLMLEVEAVMVTAMDSMSVWIVKDKIKLRHLWDVKHVIKRRQLIYYLRLVVLAVLLRLVNSIDKNKFYEYILQINSH